MRPPPAGSVCTSFGSPSACTSAYASAPITARPFTVKSSAPNIAAPLAVKTASRFCLPAISCAVASPASACARVEAAALTRIPLTVSPSIT